jgi:hypothetical protein
VKTDRKTAKRKAPYQPPKLRVIELATQEVLGIGCSTVSSQVYVSSCKLPGQCKA